MAEVTHKTPADRAEALMVGVHPRRDGELVLTPEDLMEGRGNFANVDAEGNPEGFVLVEPPIPDSRNVYGGTSPDALTKQNAAPLGLERSSYVVNHPLVKGDELPTRQNQLAPLPRPGKAILKKLRATNAGYLAGTSTSPHWFAFSWGKRGQHTPLGPPVSAESANGQSFRIALPEQAAEGADSIGIWMAAPGASTATRPGDFFLQRDLKLESYGAPYFDLTGPFRFGTEEPTDNETKLPSGSQVGYRFVKTNTASRIGTYYFKLTWARGMEEGMPGPVSGPHEVEGSTYYNDPDTPVGQIPEKLAGYGYFDCKIPRAPRDATGYYLYVMVGDEWHRAYDKRTGEGRTKPWRLSKREIEVAGWGPGSEFGANDNVLLEGQDAPETDESGIAPPDFRPEEPESFGAARPAPGVYYYRTTDGYRGLESPASPVESIEVGNLDIVRVVFASPVNDMPNSTFVEKAADGLPLDHTILQTGGVARMEGGELVLETSGAVTGTTPYAANENRAVDRTKPYEVVVHFEVQNPKSGALQGQVQAVLEQISTTGAVTRTVLKSANRSGQWKAQAIIEDGAAVSFGPNTVEARLRVEFAGTTKNAIVRISRQLFKPYKWDIRRRQKRPGRPSNPNPPPEVVHPPGSDLGLEPSPAPPEVPDTDVVPSPDRPRSVGTLAAPEVGFDASAPDTGWTRNEAGGAVVQVDATAALDGALGGRLRKVAGGTDPGRASLSRLFPTPPGLAFRHDAGLAVMHRIAALSGDNYLDLDKIARPGDEAYLAYLRYGNAREAATLTIDRAPTTPGNVGLTLDGTLFNVATNAIREQAQLQLTGNPTAPGTVGITLGRAEGGVSTRQVTVGGTTAQYRVEIISAPYASGYHGIRLGATTYQIHSWSNDSRSEVASEIAWRGIPGWNVTSSGRFVYMTAQLPGPQPVPTYNAGPTGITAAVLTQQVGAAETAAQLADRIRATSFPGWTVGGTAGSTLVTFQSVEGGPRADAAFDPGSTGVAGSMTTTQQGAIDTAADLAARIRATAFAGWTTGGTGREITFVHNVAGVRHDPQYDPRATGALGRFVKTQEGAVGDVIAYCRDLSDPNGRRARRIMTGIGPTTIWRTDVTVSGAGTEEAIVSVWGALGTTNPMQLLVRWENVDLTGYPAGVREPGVWRDSDPSATWDVHVDRIRATERGETFFRDHDYRGGLINQLHYHGVPNQPRIPGMPLSGYRQAVLPGQLYAFGGFYRWSGVPENRPAMPTFITAYTTRGRKRRLLDITGAGGLSGESSWQEMALDGADAVRIPEDCYEIGIESERVGQGTIVMQELACSPGSVVKRTPLRTTVGSYRPTFRTRPRRKPSFVYYGERRRMLEADVVSEAGSAHQITYRSGPSMDGPWGPWYTDPLAVPHDTFLQVDISGTGNGVSTFSVRPGSPRLVYESAMGEEPVPTLLREDGSEFLGGAVLIDPDEWSAPPDVGVNRLPGGRLRRAKLYDGAEQLPENSLLVFTEEDKREIEETCLTEIFRADMWGDSLYLAFSGGVRFKRQGAKHPDRDGHYRSLYVAELPYAEVVRRQELPLQTAPPAVVA